MPASSGCADPMHAVAGATTEDRSRTLPRGKFPEAAPAALPGPAPAHHYAARMLIIAIILFGMLIGMQRMVGRV